MPTVVATFRALAWIQAHLPGIPPSSLSRLLGQSAWGAGGVPFPSRTHHHSKKRLDNLPAPGLVVSVIG